MIGSSCGLELPGETVRRRRPTIPQIAADSLCKPEIQVGNFAWGSGKSEYMDGLDIRGNHT
ncbi:MAG: hypothetical protein ACLPOO_13705 [Terriglobales bacterium]